MNFKEEIATKKLCSATVYFFNNDTKEIIMGKWDDNMLENMPKVVLYQEDDNHYINLFNVKDKTPIFKRSNFSTGKMIPVSSTENLKTGACYVLDNYRDYFPFYSHSCTMDELIDSILLQPIFFLYRPELARYKINKMEKKADEEEMLRHDDTIVRNMPYLQKLMRYRSIEYHDNNKRQEFYRYFKTLMADNEKDREKVYYKK